MHSTDSCQAHYSEQTMSSLSEQRMNSVTKFSSNVQPTFPYPSFSEENNQDEGWGGKPDSPLAIWNCLLEHWGIKNVNHILTSKQRKLTSTFAFKLDHVVLHFCVYGCASIFIRKGGGILSDKVSVLNTNSFSLQTEQQQGNFIQMTQQLVLKYWQLIHECWSYEFSCFFFNPWFLLSSGFIKNLEQVLWNTIWCWQIPLWY